MYDGFIVQFQRKFDIFKSNFIPKGSILICNPGETEDVIKFLYTQEHLLNENKNLCKRIDQLEYELRELKNQNAERHGE